MKTPFPRITVLLSAVAFAFSHITSMGADAVLPKEMRLAFLGDSITEIGNASPGGYVRLVVNGLEGNGVKVTPIAAGTSGNTSNDMLARVDRDVISKKPDMMLLSCGVNDAWHQPGVALDVYKKNITSIVDQAQAAGIKVMILTATVIFEDINSKENQRLAPYNEFLRALAKEKKCLLADLNADMWPVITAAKLPPGGRLLTGDGVHMNMDGNLLMAKGVMKGFGLSEGQMNKAWQAMMNAKDGAFIGAGTRITLAEYYALKDMAAKKNMTLDNMMDGAFRETVEALKKSLTK